MNSIQPAIYLSRLYIYYFFCSRLRLGIVSVAVCNGTWHCTKDVTFGTVCKYHGNQRRHRQWLRRGNGWESLVEHASTIHRITIWISGALTSTVGSHQRMQLSPVVERLFHCTVSCTRTTSVCPVIVAPTAFHVVFMALSNEYLLSSHLFIVLVR